MPLVLGAASAPVAAGYSIDNSCRFNGVDGYLDLTFGTPTDNDKWSVSMWLKRSGSGADNEFMMVAASNSTNYTELQFSSLEFWAMMNEYQGGAIARLTTNAYYLDMSAWYHMLFVYDSGNGVAGDRMKIYVNGTEITSFSTDNNPSLDQSSMLNSAVSHTLGSNAAEGGSRYFSGYIAEVVVCDGQAYAASDFGEFNEDSPTVWQPIDPSGLTFGDNGCYLDFKDSADLGNDVSGNNNDWTVNNLDATDQSTDSPTNNFCTINSLDNYYEDATLAEGNCSLTTKSGTYSFTRGTFGVSAGKWYWEVKIEAQSATDLSNFGIVSQATTASNRAVGKDLNCWGIYAGIDGYVTNNTDTSNWCDNFTTGDIMSIALDLDNNKLYAAKAGSWSDGTGNFDEVFASAAAIDITDPASTVAGAYFPAASYQDNVGTATYQFNFGNPTFAITSGNADGNGYGNFEYAVPSGYLALCTKNLGSDGG